VSEMNQTRSSCASLEDHVVSLQIMRMVVSERSTVNSPRRPNRLPRMLFEAGVGPPMEKPGFRDSGLPVQTVPMTPSMRASSTPMPITLQYTHQHSSGFMNNHRRQTLIDGCNNFSKAGDAIARNVSMVGQRIESRARSALVISSRRLESMDSSDIDGLRGIYEESLGLLVLVH
jgi:hypothetical protein